MAGRAWTKEEDQFLVENYKTMPIKDISKKLNRTVMALINRTTKLRIGSSRNNTIVFTRKCEYCGKEFATQNNCKKYCNKECRYEQTKLNHKQYFQEHKQELYKKAAERRDKFKHHRKDLVRRSNKDISAFFELECLSVDAHEGIKKVRKFTGRKDAEKIYRILRNNFIHSKNF